jgi:hypothetical protein
VRRTRDGRSTPLGPNHSISSANPGSVDDGSAAIAPEQLIATSDAMRRTDRVRVTLAAWLSDGGDLSTKGLKQALATRTGAHRRMVERVLSEHRKVTTPTA